MNIVKDPMNIIELFFRKKNSDFSMAIEEPNKASSTGIGVPMEEVELVHTTSKEEKVKNITPKLQIEITVADRLELEYHKKVEPVYGKITESKYGPIRLPPTSGSRTQVVFVRDQVPEDTLIDSLTTMYKDSNYAIIKMPDTEETIYGISESRITVDPESRVATIVLPVLKYKINTADKHVLTDGNMNNLRMQISGNGKNIVFLLGNRQGRFFKQTSLSIGGIIKNSSKGFNKWASVNKADPEHYHDIHTKAKSKINYPSVYDVVDPYTRKQTEYENEEKLNQWINDYRKKSIPKFLVENPGEDIEDYKTVLRATFDFIEEETVYDYEKAGFEADLQKPEIKSLRDWNKYTTVKKKYAQNSDRQFMYEGTKTESKIEIEVSLVERALESGEIGQYVVIRGEMDDTETFKNFVKFFTRHIESITIEGQPMTDDELSELQAGRKQGIKVISKEELEARKKDFEKAQEDVVKKMMMETLTDKRSMDGTEEFEGMTKEKYDQLDAETKEEYDIWAFENGRELFN